MKKILIIFLIFSQTAFSATQFEKIQSKNLNDLGPQCALQNESQLADFEQNYYANDEDFALNYSEFIQKVKKNGLLERSLFYTPGASSPDHEDTAIRSIVSWTEHYIQSGRVDKKENCYLNAKEIFSLFYYTGEGYKILNKAIRNNDTDFLKKLAVIGKHLNSALDKIKPYQGYVKRGQKASSDNQRNQAFIKQYKVGQIVTQAGYTSTTIANAFPGEYQFVIKTKKNCHYIADFSLVEQKDASGYSQMEEEEVLCKPYTRFKVIAHDVVGEIHQITLEEVVDELIELNRD